MPRVLFVHHRPHLGGAVKSLSLLVSALDPRWEAHAVAPEGPAADVLREAGVQVHPAPVPAFTHTWDVQYHDLRWLVLGRELASAPSHMRAFTKTLHDVDPAIVHVNDSVMLLSGELAARAGFPVVWHLRSSLPHGGRDRRSGWVLRRLDRSGVRAIAIDADVAATFPLHLPVDLIPNPVDVPDGPTADIGVPAGRVAVGYVGYLRRQKGWPQFLEAMHELVVDRGLPAHAVFVGGGIRPAAAFRGWRRQVLARMDVNDEESALRLRVRELGLTDHVSLREFTADPLPVLRALDIVVWPNQGIGLGRPVIEAAAVGKAVVASGSRDGAGILLPGKTGILLPNGSPQELAAAVAELISDTSLRSSLGIAAARHIAVTASPAAVAMKVDRIWTEILSETES